MKDIINFKSAIANIYVFFHNYKTNKELDQYIQEVAKRCANFPVELPPEFYKSLIYYIADDYPNMDSKDIVKIAVINENVIDRIMLAFLEKLQGDKKDERH